MEQHWYLRTQKQLDSQLSRAAKLTGTKQKEFMQRKGLNSLAYAMQPSLIPHFKASEMSPMDVMHGEPDGLLSEEGYYL
eukprot:2224599-Pleurochrysis_carterae.AAC.1